MSDRPSNREQRGFTIVELMIAITVLSVILVITTILITNIGNLYYKGVNQSRIQNSVRDITDDIAANLQLSGQPVTAIPPSPQNGFPKVGAYCVGTVRYTYAINAQQGTNPGQIAHVLWRDSLGGASCSRAILSNPALSGGTELMSPNSRLTYFDISSGSPYTISIAAAYGDTSLLAIDLSNPANTHCVGGAGDSFCSTAYITTIATQRVAGN